MTINTTILKEKSIDIRSIIPAPKMQIGMDRDNIMPESPGDNKIQCELKLSVTIYDDEKNELVLLKLSHIVIATLGDGEAYSQNDCADRLFKALQPMYIAEANSLLRDSPYPPIPLNISC